MGSPIAFPDRQRSRLHARLSAIVPALQTFGYVALMLGVFMLALVLLVAWIRTPEAYFLSTDPHLPQVVRGGESLRSLMPWLRAELGNAALLIGIGIVCVWGLASLSRDRAAA
ncbi:MAG: hypothetical protein U0133_17605 [Gemmatimonadales bacterium]